MTTTKHPAKFSLPILDVARDLLAPLVRDRVVVDLLDPFAGTGRCHDVARELGIPSCGIEIEPEWASMHPRTIIGDATRLPFRSSSWSCAFTSPCYGNRMADSHTALDDSKRNTYTHVLGRKLHARSSATLQWGPAYRELHRQAWAELDRVLRPGALVVLNLKDHYRDDTLVEVTRWHHEWVTGVAPDLFASMDWTKLDEQLVPCKGNQQGDNGDKRVPFESVAVFATAS